MLNFENIGEKFVKVVNSPEWSELQNKFNNVEILEIGKFFCNENLNYCTMKGNLNLNLIHYRDLENISQNSNINFFKSVKYLN